ncbi:hypothetical protein CKO25_11960 [Thiocapsa imhoffii]|uniref:DUF4340 domain-containing protein n=1 Tax=Thiocapsa imhoffii TaxID=382777 RepID=A0A9X0WIU4_9GAMM|nr:DUF4340 domain-containing protein [Thiocapsa imhoffii]MBK1645343.1 hypothetical protein [Thiocapsa imhoffii]
MSETPTSNPSVAELSWHQDLRTPIVLGLGVLLILQLLIALGLSLTGSRSLAPMAIDTPLFEFRPLEVERVILTSGDGAEQLTLSRTHDTWVLANLAEFPIQAAKVDQLIEDVLALRKPPPIAGSEDARKRFKVADTSFDRRLSIEGKTGPLAELIVGDSPGFRRVFARPPGDPGVYDLQLASSSLSPRRDDWIELGLLRLEAGEISAVSIDEMRLVRADDGQWSLSEFDQAVDQEAVQALIQRLANLSYRGVLGIEEEAAFGQASPVLSINIELADGSARHYRISQAVESPDFVLKDTTRPWYFKVSTIDLGELLETSLEDLVEPTEFDEDPSSAEPASPAATLEPAPVGNEPDGEDAMTVPTHP